MLLGAWLTTLVSLQADELQGLDQGTLQNETRGPSHCSELAWRPGSHGDMRLPVGRMQEDNFVPGQPPNRRTTSFTQPNLLELDLEIKSYNLERLVIALGGVSRV